MKNLDKRFKKHSNATEKQNLYSSHNWSALESICFWYGNIVKVTLSYTPAKLTLTTTKFDFWLLNYKFKKSLKSKPLNAAFGNLIQLNKTLNKYHHK